MLPTGATDRYVLLATLFSGPPTDERVDGV